jgi:ERF superfamily
MLFMLYHESHVTTRHQKETRKMTNENPGASEGLPISKGPTMEVKNIIPALVKAQLNIKPPKKTGVNPMYKNKYATYDDIMEAVRLPLAEQGITPWHSIEGDVLISRLYHASGEYLENRFPMKIEKNNSQGVASANTYAKRQAMCNLIGLPSDDDDDANMACQDKALQEKAREKITQEQKEVIEEYIGDDAGLADRILNGYKVKSFVDIEAKNFSSILNGIRKIKAAKEAK